MKYAVPVIEKKPFLHFFKRERRVLVFEVEALSEGLAIAAADDIVDMAQKQGRLAENSLFEIRRPWELLKWPTFLEIMADIEERSGL